MSDLA